MRVLVVEDEPRIAAFLVKGLTRGGYRVDHTGRGSVALERVAAGDCDLLLLDLGLPDVDGLEVLRRLRGAGHTIPVIVLTARAADREAGLRLGADEFLVKPLPFTQLLDRVRAQL